MVLVTAYTDYSIRAFEHAAFDYLLKPVTAERVGLTLGRLARRAPQGGRLSWDQGSQPMPRAEESRRFPIKVGDGVVFLDLRRVTHFELADDWAWAWHQNKRFRTPWTSLAEVEGAFPGEHFCRIQRHLLLRPMAVTALKPIWGRRVSVRVMGGMDLQVSRSMTPRLKVLLGA